jgi:hypothetical protein
MTGESEPLTSGIGAHEGLFDIARHGELYDVCNLVMVYRDAHIFLLG